MSARARRTPRGVRSGRPSGKPGRGFSWTCLARLENPDCSNVKDGDCFGILGTCLVLENCGDEGVVMVWGGEGVVIILTGWMILIVWEMVGSGGEKDLGAAVGELASTDGGVVAGVAF